MPLLFLVEHTGHVVRIQAGACVMWACRDVGMCLVALRSVGLIANLKRTLLNEYYRLLPLLTASIVSETPPLSLMCQSKVDEI
jgi:hypothetical protein